MAQSILFTEINQLMTLRGAVKKQGRHIDEKDLGIIKNGAMVMVNGEIVWVGPQKKLPQIYANFKKKSLKGKNVFPGFVDCHTHMVFAGNRVDEFELRNKGVSYQEIAKRGGGILSTVKATRKASLEELTELCQRRVNHHISQGVTTIEIKSGYGLKSSAEIKMLKAAQKIKKANIVTSFLGAHAIPKEFKSEKLYIDQLIKDLDKIKSSKLSNRVDIFIEKGYFSYKYAKKYLLAAKEKGFQICVHADQLSHAKATQLAVEVGALSADHAICLTNRDKKNLAGSETTAVLLPCADFYLNCDYPDARGLIDRGARVALATDFNPGSSPTQNLPFLGVLSRLNMKMSLAEVFVGLTLNGAYALGLHKTKGALLSGYSGDFFVSDHQWKEFFYDMNPSFIDQVFISGRAQ
mgnify:CR=1 FL=1